jgi:MoaA/NifB/PqqE/SkfB family radical SAM enzyme
MSHYVRLAEIKRFPRIPLEGSIDLTYRCNNICQHCWLWLSPHASEKTNELTFDEIRSIADQARSMGTRSWSISGGEPMIREDFEEIFDYLTRRSAEYSLNTNGTLITPRIAKLLQRKGVKMIAVYGATAEVYDSVTNHPGGFEALIRGIAYMREAGANFVVQLIPMKANWHQWEKMVEFARTLSSEYRVGAAWLHLSSSGSPIKNKQIISQRLDPKDAVNLSPPTSNLYHEEIPGDSETDDELCGKIDPSQQYLYAGCVEHRSGFHIDPYGGMSFCAIVKDPQLRFSLRKFSLKEVWEERIPSLANVVCGDVEYLEHCGSCEKREHCRWCAAYSYLETGRHTAPIPYLCQLAEQAMIYEENWNANHRRFFELAGISVCVDSDLDLHQVNFPPELMAFASKDTGDDLIVLRHYFHIPQFRKDDFGETVYQKTPWLISRKGNAWFYRGTSPDADDDYHQVAIFKSDHTRGEIYNLPRMEDTIKTHGWRSLSLMPTDQIWIIPLLADRQAVLIHSGAVAINGQGLVFVGHSDAGKSTTMRLLKEAGQDGRLPYPVEILCDDRNILRKWEDGWKVHGTWSHGDVSDVSNISVPLRAVLFLHQDKQNSLQKLTESKLIIGRLLETLIRSVETTDWWTKEMDLIGKIAKEVPCFVMKFDKSGKIVDELAQLVK